MNELDVATVPMSCALFTTTCITEESKKKKKKKKKTKKTKTKTKKEKKGRKG
jgi:hypothetical protein